MASFRNILIADDEPSIRQVLARALTEHGYQVRTVSDGEEALRELAERPYQVVISDVRMPQIDGLSLLKQALSRWPELTFVVISGFGSANAALEAVAAGAYDYLQKPFVPEELVLLLRKAEERQRLLRENRRLRSAASLERLVGVSEKIQAVQRSIRRLAPALTTVLVTGESGTGKELVARALHQLSPRAAMPFVAVNCGAIPPGLIEAELFGHGGSALTDSDLARPGLLAEAEGGTLFLDEVSALPPSAQVKLLRFLEGGGVRPLGESHAATLDVRVVAATLGELSELVKRSEFRADLFGCLSVFNLSIPPLRERKEDIALLVQSFISRFNRELNRERAVTGLSVEAEALIKAYHWPGNVRELENAIEHGMLLADTAEILPQHLPEKLWAAAAPTAAARPPLPFPQGESLSLKRAARELEETFIKAALRKTRGNRTRAAQLLEISHRSLLYKIKAYGIDPDA